MIRPEDTARALLERAAAQLQHADTRARDLLQRLRSTMPEVGSRFRVRRVYLFGSLAWGGVHAGSDADLATEGLKPEDRASFAADVSRRLGIDVDVVLLEGAPDRLRERVLHHGEILYSAGEEE